LADPKAEFYETFKHDKITFHDEDADDPDWEIRQAYTLLIAAASEIENGVENLWKRRKGMGRRDYPDFGRIMSKNAFKAFNSGAHFCWTEEEHWYKDKRDLTWDVFLPTLELFNGRQRELLKCVLLVLDESMSGWRPKSTKTGGLPKLSWEPRKPVPLGTMFRNGLECMSGILVFQDVVQAAEVMNQKEYFGEKSSMPNSMEIPAHAAEVLRQIKGENVVEGGWVGGDAWFGSMVTALEAKKRRNIDSTWIIKGNHAFYPMGELHAVIKARFGTKIGGHWVTMTTTIDVIKMMAMAYAGSQKGISYFFSTCGSTEVSSVLYRSALEDEFGNVDYKFLPRPQIAHFTFEYLPLIDEHNKQRQAVLGLERKWLTRCCWTSLLVTLMGMCVVDMQRLYRSEKILRNRILCGQILEEDATIVKLSDFLCSGLIESDRNITAVVQHRVSGTETLLERIEKYGEINLPVTKENKARGKLTGQPFQRKCFLCRK
jgi:hypothetical protein